METMPFRDIPDPGGRGGRALARVARPAPLAAGPDIRWRERLPVLRGTGVTLRELEASDALSLFAALTTEQVARFISPPPSTPAGFARFIAWAKREQAAGSYACFAVVPDGGSAAVGLFQIRALGGDFGTAEWGFALASPHWGTGVFGAGASLVLAFAFDVLGVQRLEARSVAENGRGNGALRKLGAVCEARLRRSFRKNGVSSDQHLWTLLRDEWQAKTIWSYTLH